MIWGTISSFCTLNLTITKTVYTTADKIEVKHCSMIITNRYTQTIDPNNIIEVIGSYWIQSDVQKSNVHVISITMSKYPAKSFANLNRCDTCIEGQVGLDWMRNTTGAKNISSYHACVRWIQFSQCCQDRDFVAELGSFWDS